MPSLTPASQVAFRLGAMEAQNLGSSSIDSEYFFLGLCKVEDLLHSDRGKVSTLGEMEWASLCEEIRAFKAIWAKAGFECKKARRALREILAESQKEKGVFTGHRTERCREAFSLAEELRGKAGRSEVRLEDLATAVLRQPSSVLDLLFSRLSVEKSHLLNALTDNDKKDSKEEISHVEKTGPEKESTPFLNKFGRDLTRLAREGKLEPTIGRRDEIKKVAQVLSQRKKKNAILVGEAGVGKTCVVEGLAQEVVKQGAGALIRDIRIVEVTMSSLVAGSKLRGDFEEKLEKVIKEAQSAPQIVLFIDEIHTLVGAGDSGGGTMDAANILKPALARGLIRCIGATTTPEYRKTIEKDPALERRFQLVWVEEPTQEEAILILKGLKSTFEDHYNLEIPDRVIEKAVELSVRYLTEFRLPDKAIDIIDQGCARKMLQTFSPVEKSGEMELGFRDVAAVISERCRIPAEDLSAEESERLLKMEDVLRQRVMGQEDAIREVSETLRFAKAGLKDVRKPLGVFLFLGSTGTGKTELAKALAQFLFYDENRLITFDMSEFQEKQSVNRFIGAPPGYIGHDEEGELTRKVRTNPYSVILFDEIEKAHPQVFDIFLQIFDEGRLTDSHGRRVNFSESVIILTSNLGSSVARVDHTVGFQAQEIKKDWRGYEDRIQEAVSKNLRPEIINRIQKKIIFYPLGEEVVRRIIGKILVDLNRRLSPKEIRVALSEEAKDFLMGAGYNEVYGAREMRRTFEKYVSEPLARMILRGEAKPGEEIEVSVGPQGIELRVDPVPKGK